MLTTLLHYVASQVRKVYKRMALRFHPDKALANCRFATRLSGAGAALAGARQIEDRIRSEADWLFICIGEARSVLEDAGKRAQVLLTASFCLRDGSAEPGTWHATTARQMRCLDGGRRGQVW